MNYYFLLEDEKSFLKVLPKWLEYLEFKCTRVPDITYVRENNYVLQSGRGVTQLVTKVIFDTIDTILDNPNTIDKLIVFLDTEEEDEEYRKNDVFTRVNEHYNNAQFDFELVVCVCNHCFESWLLGRERLYPEIPVALEADFYPYYLHYDIENNDPEEMCVPEDKNETTAQYHFHYLCELFRYRKMRYSKNKPNLVMDKSYFDGMKNRAEKTGHIDSFNRFIQFIYNENSLMELK